MKRPARLTNQEAERSPGIPPICPTAMVTRPQKNICAPSAVVTLAAPEECTTRTIAAKTGRFSSMFNYARTER